MTPARLSAVKVLAALERGRTTLAGELERARPEIASGRDRALFFEIVAGTLRWRNELDALLAQGSRRPVADLDANVRAIVRIGAYQLRHLDRVPVHAVVHESVELARALGHPRAAGFVNAVLRKLAPRRKPAATAAASVSRERPRRRSGVSRDDAVASGVAGRALARSISVRRGGTLVPVQQHGAGRHGPSRRRASRQRSPRGACRRWRAGVPGAVREGRDPARAGRAHPLAGRPSRVGGDSGRGVADRRARGRRASRRAGSRCLRRARRQDRASRWRHGRTRACSSPATSGPLAYGCCRQR